MVIRFAYNGFMKNSKKPKSNNMKLTMLVFFFTAFAFIEMSVAQDADEVLEEESIVEQVEVCSAPAISYIQQELKKKYPQADADVYAESITLSAGYELWSYSDLELAEGVVAKVTVLAKQNADGSSCSVVASASDFGADDSWPLVPVTQQDPCAKTVVASIAGELKIDFPKSALNLVSTAVGAKFPGAFERWELKFQGDNVAVDAVVLVKRARNSCSVIGSSFEEAF
jgi:hypothetical protein